MAAPKGNNYAAKPAKKRRDSRLNIPVTSSEKAALVKRAKGQPLADYVRTALGLG
jgi:hypothetical protein